MNDRSGLSRGDRNRNDRLVRLRGLLPAANAIVGVDLADRTQAAVVTTMIRGCWRGAGCRAGRGSWVSCWTGQCGRRGRRGSPR
jgi:hypothetical protein